MDDSDGIAPPATPVLSGNGAGAPRMKPQSTPQPVYEERNGRASAGIDYPEHVAVERTIAPPGTPVKLHLAQALDERAYRVGGWVYFIQAMRGGRIKIGHTFEVEARLRAIQSCSPIELRFLGVLSGSIHLERLLHRRFAPYRAHGEWFEPHASIRRFIARHAGAGDAWSLTQLRQDLREKGEAEQESVEAACQALGLKLRKHGREWMIRFVWNSESFEFMGDTPQLAFGLVTEFRREKDISTGALAAANSR